MRTYEERRLCPACAGAGYVDPPYMSFNANALASAALEDVQAITCPCCGGVGYQTVMVREE